MTKKKSALYASVPMCFWTLGGNINVAFFVLCPPWFVLRRDFYVSLKHCVHLTRNQRHKLASPLAAL